MHVVDMSTSTTKIPVLMLAVLDVDVAVNACIICDFVVLIYTRPRLSHRRHVRLSVRHTLVILQN